MCRWLDEYDDELVTVDRLRKCIRVPVATRWADCDDVQRFRDVRGASAVIFPSKEVTPVD